MVSTKIQSHKAQRTLSTDMQSR